MFCVECGAEGPTYKGLCARDLLKKHPVIAPPEVLDIERCTSCGSFRLKSGWSKIDRELALTGLLRETIPKMAPWERVTFTHVAREEDASNLSLTGKAPGRFEDLQSVQDFRVRVRIKPSLCDSCQKQRGRYFEGVLQVRGDGRELTPQEMRGVRTFVIARVDRAGDPAAFISWIEEVHGGLDFYLSKNALGKALARELSESLGGIVSSSPELFGQEQGRQVDRLTSLVRLGPFHIGDVVRYKESPAEATSVRPFLILSDLSTGQSRRRKPKDVRSAKRVDAERFEAKIEHLGSGQIVAVHPESEEARPVRPPPKDRTAHAVVVWTQDGAYLSLLPAETSKA